MAKKIRVKDADAVGLKLLPEERQMLLGLPLLDEGLSNRLELTAPGESQVKFTLNELDLLAGEIAGHANHTKDRKLGKKLDAICERIERIEDMFEVG
jgi:hypothetical protein